MAKLKATNDEGDSIAIKSILIIDDHPLYCDALTSALNRAYAPKTLRTAATLAEALQHISGRFTPDLIILDLNLPDSTGLSGFIKLKSKRPDVPVLVISATTSASIVQTLFEAGAAGFVPKECSRDVIAKAIYEIWQGRTFVPEGYFPKREAQADHQSNPIQNTSQKIASLTPQQSKILAFVCEGKLNKQIAFEMSLAEPTVKAHVTAMFRRLGVRNRTQAAVLVKQVSLDDQYEEA